MNSISLLDCPILGDVYAYLSILNEFINLSPNGDKIVPVFGKIFTDEPIPKDGYISLSDNPGFGVTLNHEVELEEVKF